MIVVKKKDKEGRHAKRIVSVILVLAILGVSSGWLWLASEASRTQECSIPQLYLDSGSTPYNVLYEGRKVKVSGKVWYEPVLPTESWRMRNFPMANGYICYLILEELDPIALVPRRLHVWLVEQRALMRGQTVSVQGTIYYVPVTDPMTGGAQWQPYLLGSVC